MFAKFEAFMNKYLMPFAQKVDKQRHLSSIKAAMVAMTPFTILGSFLQLYQHYLICLERITS
nr:hypothetical protein [Clostridium perfringens]